MNERIKQLAEQAELNATLLFNKEKLEKFAGLIVAECMDVFGRDLPEPGDGRMTDVIDRICRVAEHFGVES